METERVQRAQSATKAQMRWPCGGVGGDGYPGDSCLRDALEQLRPWTGEVAVAAALQTWAESHHQQPVDRLGLADVASHLKIIGPMVELPNPDEAAGIAAFMLVNIAKGRDARDYDMLREHVVGIPASTARRYRQWFGEAAFSEYMRHIQYEQDLVALMRAGRKLPAARRYLQRHPRTPSMSAYPAPPARRLRSDPPIDRDVVRVEGGPATDGRADGHALHDDGEDAPAGA
jgi:hypothetical protein